MTRTINSTPPSGSLRMHTKASQPRTSSNATFKELFGAGLKTGVQASGTALGHMIRPIPGGAALAASINDAALSLDSRSSGPGLANSSAMSAGLSGDSDTNSLQDDLVRKNQDMLDQQMRVAHITTIYNAKSNLIKALFDVLKTIGSNIR